MRYPAAFVFTVALVFNASALGCIKSVEVHPCAADPGSTACVNVCAEVMAKNGGASPAVGK